MGSRSTEALLGKFLNRLENCFQVVFFFLSVQILEFYKERVWHILSWGIKSHSDGNIYKHIFIAWIFFRKQLLSYSSPNATFIFKGLIEYIKPVYCHPGHLTYMQSTSYKMLGWMKHNLESRLPREISITSDRQMTSPLWQRVKKN